MTLPSGRPGFAAIAWGLAAGWGDASLAWAVGRHLATRLMGAHPGE